MSAGLFRIESAGLADSGGFSGRPAARLFQNKLIWLLVVLVVARAGMEDVFRGSRGPRRRPDRGQDEFRHNRVDPTLAIVPIPHRAATQSSAPAAGPPEAAPVNGLRISSQSWRRGGLGSKALVTFTLRNDNDYAVGDIGLLCAFTRADGSPVTERRPTIRDTVKMKSRKTFARMHVGFINVNANRAKCTLLSASRV